MSNTINPNNGAFLLRVTLGTVLLAHSLYLKLVIFTLAGTAQYFSSIGLPGILAYGVFLVEAVAGIALIPGWQVRFFSALAAPVLLGATWAHWSSGWLFTNSGGGWEYPLFLTIAALVQFNLGAGSYALNLGGVKLHADTAEA